MEMCPTRGYEVVQGRHSIAANFIEHIGAARMETCPTRGYGAVGWAEG